MPKDIQLTHCIGEGEVKKLCYVTNTVNDEPVYIEDMMP